MTWFQRNHTGRELFPWERQFIDVLEQVLIELAAPQVDATETALTAEDTNCLIALLPHRALGGISIVVWLFKDSAEVTWAHVAALDCCHDSLDLGISVARFRFNRHRPDFSAVLECIRRQFSEPLTFRVFDGQTASVSVPDHRGVLREVGRVGAASRVPGVFRPGTPTMETQIRLTDASPPPVTEPSGVDGWFSSRGSGQ